MNGEKRLWLLISLLAIAALLIAACSSTPAEPSVGDESAQVAEESDEHMQEGEPMEEDEHTDEGEHMEGEHADDHEHAEVPHEYEALENPFAGDADALAAGAELFAVNCVSCHGDTGMGDGPAAAALDPHPATLADSEMMSELSDAYIFWRISEGGVGDPFNSAMPPWGEVFSVEQRWQLVTFVRSLAQ